MFENNKVLAKQAEEVIKRGSLSFALASRLLEPQVRNSVVMLYSWCRYCDDQIDGQTLGHISRLISHDHDVLVRLRAETRDALAGKATTAKAMEALSFVAARHALPAFYVEELLAGMEMDVAGRRYQDLDELLLYCYRVAGTVGLLFVHIAGVSAEVARRHAADLGIAMQLTNIARDVGADSKLERLYLPLDWLAMAGVDPQDLMAPSQRVKLFTVVKRLLKEADRFYASGDRGINYLPLRTAFAVTTARLIYAAIGQEILRRGDSALVERAVVSRWRKICLVAKAFVLVFKTIPVRLARPWRAVPLQDVWRLT